MDDETLGKLIAEVHRDYADYRCPEGVSVSPSSMSVMVDRTEEPVERSDIDHFGFSVRNVKSAQNQPCMRMCHSVSVLQNEYDSGNPSYLASDKGCNNEDGVQMCQ